MKKCPYCNEEIQDSAKKCRYCGEWLKEKEVNEEKKEQINVVGHHTRTEAIHKTAPSDKFLITTQGKRFVNFLIDGLCICVIVAIISAMFGLNNTSYSDNSYSDYSYSADTSSSSANNSLLAILILVLYYVIFESTCGKTVGKFVTKTKVINEYGETPDFANVLGRSLCRIIPFEPFSFFVGSHPIGWHDSISKTYVVEDEPR